VKQVFVNPRTGNVEIVDVPIPQAKPGMVLVRNRASLISSGTERMVLTLAAQGLVGKARARPDLVREILNKMRRDGVRTTVREAWSRLETPLPLGYSSAGVVLETGPGVHDLKVGDRVACSGAGWASHAEVVAVPRRLCVRLPEAIGWEAGAFGMLGAIALHGIRRAGAGLGEIVAVLGLGIVGQLALQMLRVAGCRVLAFDPLKDRVALALTLGADVATDSPDDAVSSARLLSEGSGVDAVLVAASTASDAPLELAAELARPRARVVMVGVTGMRVPRRPFWQKELTLLLSRASGPGSEEADDEKCGAELSRAYVRWTADRNVGCFLDEVARGTVRVEPLITHRFPIERAREAYDLLRGRRKEPHLGILLTYEDRSAETSFTGPHTLVLRPATVTVKDSIGIGVIGAGLFARTILLPALRTIPALRLRGIAAASGGSARSAGDRFGFEYATTDPKEILGDDEVQAVIIATRHDLHPALVAEALRAGKHVFVEKPLAITVDGLQEVIQAYMHSPRVLMVGHNRRFSPLVQEIKTFLGNTRPLVVVYRVNAGTLAPGHWVYDPVEGGGRWLAEGCHFIDLIQYVTGSEPVQVFARGISPDGVANSLVTIIVFADGSCGLISYVDGSDRGVSRERVDIQGEGIACSLEDFRVATLTRRGRARRIRRWESERGYREELAEWLAAIRGEKPPPVDFASYVANVATCIAVLESARKGGPVPVDITSFLEKDKERVPGGGG